MHICMCVYMYVRVCMQHCVFHSTCLYVPEIISDTANHPTWDWLSKYLYMDVNVDVKRAE